MTRDDSSGQWAPIGPDNFPEPGDIVSQVVGNLRVTGEFVSGDLTSGIGVISLMARLSDEPGPLIPTHFHVHLHSLKVMPRNLFGPPAVEIVPATAALLKILQQHPDTLNLIPPAAFEDLIQDRLDAAGYNTERVGKTNSPDGGVDIIACPRSSAPIPFLLAVQVKHKRRGSVSAPAVRDFRGVLSSAPFNAGVIVTNTTFTPDAKWFAAQNQSILHLRDVEDLRRWLANNFLGEEEWRALPDFIELRPGVKVRVPRNWRG